MSEKSEDLSFENALNRLEQLIEAMEDGDVPLVELVEKFEEGTKLLKVCEGQLKRAELKIEKLKSLEGDGEAEPFEVSPESE